jgi:hypothetical protein
VAHREHYHWDPVWFGVLLTLKVALGQFTPPLAVNLMVSCRIAGVRMEQTVRWVGRCCWRWAGDGAGDRLAAAGAVAAARAGLLMSNPNRPPTRLRKTALFFK